MTESNQTPDPVEPTPDPVVPDPVEPATPPPAKKAAAKKAPAKKAAPSAESKKDPKSLYLPALPDDFHYTGISITGPNGESIEVSPATGTGIQPGSAVLTFDGAGSQRQTTYGTMPAAIKAGAKVAKGMADVAKREKELAEAREAAFDL